MTNYPPNYNPLILFFAYLPIAILMIIAMWKIFTKAGQPGWACIVPFYNIIVMLRIVGKPWWWLLMILSPLISFFFVVMSPVLFGLIYLITIIIVLIYAIWINNMLSKSFGKDEGFTVGLTLLGFIFYPILAFGKAQYHGPYGNPQAFAAYKNRNAFDFEQNKLQD